MKLIVICPSGQDCEAELELLGFRKEEVWLKDTTETDRSKAEEVFWRMKHTPLQFAAFNYWGAGPD